MIILKVKVNKYKAEYFENRKQIRKDIEKIFNFRQHGRTYEQIWKIARDEYNLKKRELVITENEDDVLTYYHTTFWSDNYDQEVFYERYLKAYIDELKSYGFKVKIKRKEVSDDRLIEDWKC